MKKIIAAILAIQMIGVQLQPRAEAAVPKSDAVRGQPNMIIKLLRNEATRTKDLYFDSQMSGTEARLQNKQMVLSQIQDLVLKLKDDSYSLDSIRSGLIAQMQIEERAHVIELNSILGQMPPETLDRIFEDALKMGFYPQSTRDGYANAFSANEKRAVIFGMIQGDLAQSKAASMKRLGLMDRHALIQELESTQSVLTLKDKDTWWIVALVVVTLVASGFVSWAIVSATEKRYDKLIAQAKRDAERRKADLNSEYDARDVELVAAFEEQRRLRDEGFVWAVCGTRTQTTTASCSYDFQSHTGTQVCVTRCLKNPSTGQEMFNDESCSSAFIPSNCFMKNPYVAGYDDGFDSGYDDGYSSAYDEYYKRVYDEYYRMGYDDGYIRGYDSGYSTGYSDGVAQAEYDSTPVVDDPDDGWDDGLDDDSTGDGYEDGYSEGYSAALAVMTN